MWNVERVICNSLWALWVAAMADRPADKTPAWPHARRGDVSAAPASAAGQLYPERTMLPGW